MLPSRPSPTHKTLNINLNLIYISNRQRLGHVTRIGHINIALPFQVQGTSSVDG